jgi:hypothetical protein
MSNSVHDKDSEDKKEVFFKTSMENPNVKDGPFQNSSRYIPKNYFSKWSTTSLILSTLCILWLMVDQTNSIFSWGFSWLPGFMFIPGTVLAIVAFFGATLRILFHLKLYSLAPAFLIILLGILPLALTWAPAPYGVLFTVNSHKAGYSNECISSTNVTIEGTTSPQC